MHSLFHCIWTGPTFPYRLRVFIKTWVSHFARSKSEFKLIVWLTKDSYDKATEYLSSGFGNSIDQKGWSRPLAGVDVLLNPVKINFNNFYIAMAEPLLAEHDPDLHRAYELFHSHKYYTSVGNIFRVLVVNKVGGIYTDVDYLMPNLEQPFPKDLSEILSVFSSTSTIDFYMSAVDRERRTHIENQCLILSPARTGKLNRLIDRMAKKLGKNFTEITQEAESNMEYLQNSVTQLLEKSMFMPSGKERYLLEVYKQKKYEKYGKVVKELYKNETQTSIVRKGDSSLISKYGSRHKFYKHISDCTYSNVCACFSAKLKISLDEYFNFHWYAFKQFFSAKDIDKQFLFLNEEGEARGMYNWANPGYARLTSLENAVRIVEKYYTPGRPVKIPVVLAEHFYKEMKSEFLLRRARAREASINSVMTLGAIMRQEFSSRRTMEPDEAEYFVKLLLSTFYNASTHECDFIVILVTKINQPVYMCFRKIVDPEKRRLTVEDLDSFMRGW